MALFIDGWITDSTRQMFASYDSLYVQLLRMRRKLNLGAHTFWLQKEITIVWGFMGKKKGEINFSDIYSTQPEDNTGYGSSGVWR